MVCLSKSATKTTRARRAAIKKARTKARKASVRKAKLAQQC